MSLLIYHSTTHYCMLGSLEICLTSQSMVATLQSQQVHHAIMAAILKRQRGELIRMLVLHCYTLLFPTAALPTLDIAEGALNNLFKIYKDLLPKMGGYLTYAGQLDRSRLEMLLRKLGELELEVLEERAQVGRLEQALLWVGWTWRCGWMGYGNTSGRVGVEGR